MIKSQTRGDGERATSPSSTQMNRLVADIQTNVRVLSQSLGSMGETLASCDEGLRYLMNEVEEEQCSNFDKLKTSLESIMVSSTR